MRYDEFLALVRRMRDAQKRYFTSRYGGTRAEALDESRKLEMEVDRAISLGGMNKMFEDKEGKPIR